MNPLENLMAHAENYAAWCYDAGNGRIEGPQAIGIDGEGNVYMVMLAIEADSVEEQRLISVKMLRELVRDKKIVAFGIVSEAWVLDFSSRPDLTKAEIDCLLALSKKAGVCATGLQKEMLSIFAFTNDGATALKCWLLHYDDTKKPRRGDPGPSRDGTGGAVESFWKKVFDPVSSEATH